MKNIIYIIATLYLLTPTAMWGQEQQPQGSLRDRIAKRQQQEQTQEEKKSSLPQLSVRAQMKNANNTQDLTNATWIREVYRFLDLTEGSNAALFYPVAPIEDRMNLYTLIFKLMASGELDAYQFNEGEPIFTPNLRVKPEEMFERLEIGFTKEGNTIVYDDFSVPSNEVLGYYVKEAWYFDQSNSVLDVKTVAICPVLFRDPMDGFGSGLSTTNALREPQFWIPYENIRPYAARMPIMTSDINNALRKTVDDYFRLRLYDGEIYKTTNMTNKVLIEMYPTEEALKEAQEKIENQLTDFEKGLWVINDSTKVSDGDPKRIKAKELDRPKGSSSASDATHSARERRKKF